MVYIIDDMRTNNFTDDCFIEKINNLYHKAHIKMGTDATSSDFYAIYYNYLGNYKEDYTLALATEKFETDEEFELVNQKYEIFEVDKFKKDGIRLMWQYIWDLEDKGELKRSYIADYEKYSKDGTIEIYVGIK